MVEFLGGFKRPPLASGGSVYAIGSSGGLQEMGLVAGAKPQTLAELSPAAACNRSALVEVDALGTELLRMRRAPVLLAVHPGGVDAVVLATGAAVRLHEVLSTAELLVNDPGNAAGFRGVAADRTQFAFAERSGPGRVGLVLRAFSQAGKGERVLELSGAECVGPVLCGGLLVLGTAQAVGLYDLGSRRGVAMDLPRGFEPMLSRQQGSVHVSAGTIPLSAERTPAGEAIFLAGSQSGLAGLLTLWPATGGSSFEPLGRGSSLCSNPDGSLSLASNDEIRVLGNGPAVRHAARLQFGMPAAVEGRVLCCFGEESHRGLHRLLVGGFGTGQAGMRELMFEDPACQESTCAGPLQSGPICAVPYFLSSAEGNSGIRLAVWDLSP